MSTINISGIEFNVVYIDPSISPAGSGTTPLNALADIPTFANLQNNTAYLIRRLGSAYTLNFPYGTSSTSSLNYVFMAMPKTTDPMYEMMPSEAKAAWDSDSSSNEYAFVKANSSSFVLSGSNIIFNLYRLYLQHDGLSSNPSKMISLSSTDYTNIVSVENCKFGYKGYEIDQDTITLLASAISEQETIYYEASGANESSCNGKYKLISGTHGQTDAVYENIVTGCKIFYYIYDTELGYGEWYMYNTVGSSSYYFSYSGITGTWETASASYPAPTVSSSQETLDLKVEISGGVGTVNGKYYLSSGTHGTTGAEYTNANSGWKIFFNTDKWYLKSLGAVTPEFEGTSSLTGNYSGDAFWNSLPSYGMNSYLSFGKIKSFEMRGCKININPNGNSSESRRSAVHIEDKRLCSISNCDVFSTCSTGGNSYSIFSLWGSASSTYYSQDEGSYTRLYGLNFKIFKYATSSGTTNYIPFCILDNYSSFLEMKYISLNMPADKQIGNGTVTTIAINQTYNSSSYGYFTYGLIAMFKVGEFDIDNITVNLPQFWKTDISSASSSYGSSSIFILVGNEGSNEYGYNYNSITPGATHSLKNISINCAQGVGIGTYDGLDSNNSTGNYYSNIANSNFSYPVCGLKIYNYLTEPWTISGISVSNPHGVAMEISGCWLEATTISGTIRASNSIINIQNLSTWYAGKAIATYNSSTVKVDNLTFGSGGSATPNDEFACMNESYSSKSFVYVGTSNRQMLSDTRSSSSSYSNRYSVICANEKFTGRYTLRTENCLCMTYGTFRTSPLSQVPATLKLQNNMTSTNTALELGQPPFGGFQLTPQSTGKQVLYIYGATLDFGDWNSVKANIGKNILVEVVIPTANGKRSVISTSGSWILDETSTWSDSNISATGPDATGYPVYLKLPLNVETTSTPLDIKVHYNWYSTNGVFFLDPFFTLSAN